MANNPTVISLFSGAGGLDYGFEAAGFRTGVALEMDADCCATLKANRRWEVIKDDIHRVESKVLLTRAGVRKGEVDVVIGGPPCQPFSKSGYWAKGDSARLDDPRAKTLDAFLRVIEDTQPRAFMLENVTGISYRNKSEGVDLLKARIASINEKRGTNYIPYCEVLKAVEHGVPQRRERFFMVAHREGTEFKFPVPRFAELEDIASGAALGRLPAHTAWDALHNVSPEPGEEIAARGYWADLLPAIPEGQNYLYHTSRGGGRPLFGWRRRYWSFLLKLGKNLPSWTIQAQPGPAIGPFHWDNRRLSMRELCRLQTFPDNVEITGSRGAVQRQVGNAVPSLLAELVAREIRGQLLDGTRKRSEPKLMPDTIATVPPPAKVKPVPVKYRKHEGDHDAHPGTGKGFAALQRAGADLGADANAE